MIVIKIKNGYYKADSRYQPVARELADRLTVKEAARIAAGLKKLGYTPVREKA